MPSLIDLVNYSLSEFGSPPVSAISDSPLALIIANKIKQVHPELLLLDNWTFGIVYREDNTPLSNNFSPDYQFTYQLPGDFGRFYRWASTSSQYPIYEFVQNLMLAQVMPVMYYYIANNVPYSILPPLYSHMLSIYAAHQVSLANTENVKLTEYLFAKYEKIKSQAITYNNMDRPVFQMPYNDFNRLLYI